MATQVTIDISSADGSLQLKADAVQVLFAGFLKAFESFDTSVKGGSPSKPLQPDCVLATKPSVCHLTPEPLCTV